jgi:hypothetical protein
MVWLVFDDMCTSVHSDPDMEPDTWRQLITSFSCRLQVVVDNDDNPDLVDDWHTPDERLLRDDTRRQNAVTHQRGRFHTKPDDPALTLEREKMPQDADETAMNCQPAVSAMGKKRYDLDTPSYMEAMRGANAEDHWVTMKGEIDDSFNANRTM